MTVQEFMRMGVNDNIDDVHCRIASISSRITDISSQLRDKAKGLTLDERAGDKWMYDSLISFIDYELSVLSKRIEDNVKGVNIDIK